uniref:ParB/RepB/Spo0J family partition protein n=1 Tax=Herbidospora sakaeratensis TaxID=564415 RepID=UPI000781594B|nr:ParB/RepB/Spo0J family partition protein [Herbidospora sakaeratensis]
MVTYGVPPQAAETRAMIDERLREAIAANGEKISIEWRGQPKHLYVISMPVGLLYFNPDTHRIRAQRTLDPARDRLLDNDPWGESSQDYLAKLLRCQPADPDKVDPEFESLRDSLESFGQKDPGIITYEGILVNGNTRCAALRDLGEKYIRVGVLPDSSTWDDINTVELSLQLRKEFKRDYSYINRLIAIAEQMRSGRRVEDIARDFHIRTKTLEQDQWVYAVILDAIERSKTAAGAALRLVDFEDHQEKLREMHRAYKQLAGTDKDAAEALKESRLAMVVLNFAKTDLRHVQGDFHVKYLNQKLPSFARPSVEDSSSVSIPGLPGVVVPDSAPATKAARTLTDQVLKARATASLTAPGADIGQVTQASQVITAVRDSFEGALKPAGRDGTLRQRQLAAPDRLSDACDLIDLCMGDLAKARATQALDQPAFDDAVVRLRESLEKLAKQASRAFPEPGDGVAWLLSITDPNNE